MSSIWFMFIQPLHNTSHDGAHVYTDAEYVIVSIGFGGSGGRFGLMASAVDSQIKHIISALRCIRFCIILFSDSVNCREASVITKR